MSEWCLRLIFLSVKVYCFAKCSEHVQWLGCIFSQSRLLFFFFRDFVRLEPSSTESPRRPESKALARYATGPSSSARWFGTARCKSDKISKKKKKTFRIGGRHSPFSISSSLILAVVLLPFFLKRKVNLGWPDLVMIENLGEKLLSVNNWLRNSMTGCEWRGGGGGGGICNKTAHQIRVRVNACAVHAYISCERMRSACLKFVPQTWWRAVRGGFFFPAAPRTA